MVLVEGAFAALSEGLNQVRAYWLDRYEVSVGQYEKCVVAGRCSSEVDKVNVPGAEAWSSYCTYPKRMKNQELAMNCVSWAQAKAYCEYRFARLPTEQEWYGASFDARQDGYPWGLEGPKPGQVNLCDEECAKTLVKSGLSGNKEPFVYGSAYEDKHVGVSPISAYPEDRTLRAVVGMGGNVMEWTSREDTKGKVMVRGGSWLADNPKHIDSRAWYWVTKGDRRVNIGFRCARSKGEGR
jgi:formylglycine-generating enzyme required for sulfatase activity